MKNIPNDLVLFLEENYTLNKLIINNKQTSKDGTIKCTLKLFDNNIIETVLIPSEKRVTLCISSQVGCSLDCNFCATAKLKHERNLFAYEIFEQVFIMNELSKKEYNKEVTNIVYMGMGEPLLNYNNVITSVEYLNSQEKGLNISKRKITISTSGISKKIKQLAIDLPTINLALSLHSANDKKRSELMSINNSNNLGLLLRVINYWYEKTGEPITYEYILWDKINDAEEDIKELVEFCKKAPCKVNLIRYNDVEGDNYIKAGDEILEKYLEILAKNNITVMVRQSRGEDIDAACGQLAGKN